MIEAIAHQRKYKIFRITEKKCRKLIAKLQIKFATFGAVFELEIRQIRKAPHWKKAIEKCTFRKSGVETAAAINKLANAHIETHNGRLGLSHFKIGCNFPNTSK